MFGDVSVLWRVTPGDGVDIQPREGTVTFIQGQSTATFVMESVPDDVCFTIIKMKKRFNMF